MVFISNNVKCQKIEENLGSWFMYFGTHKLSEKYSLHYETQLRNYKIVSNFNQLLPRVGLNYHIDKNTSLTAGYAFIPTQNIFDLGWDEQIITENRIWEQFILKNVINRVKIRHRYRLEQRWIKKVDVVQISNNTSFSEFSTSYKNRARYMLSVKFPISKNEESPLFVSLYDEIFLNISDSPFDQNRLFAALGYQINKQMNFQVGYLRHRSGGLNLNRLQLAVFLNTGN
jgi:hypothetical protein|tara:strand:- start:36 stop:722 length:687 start_codon:yes stop_codon:yes gene_type:complete